jgi:hypothetical protein
MWDSAAKLSTCKVNWSQNKLNFGCGAEDCAKGSFVCQYFFIGQQYSIDVEARQCNTTLFLVSALKMLGRRKCGKPTTLPS